MFIKAILLKTQIFICRWITQVKNGNNNITTVSTQVVSHTGYPSTSIGYTSNDFTLDDDTNENKRPRRKRDFPSKGPAVVERRNRKIYLQLGLVILSFMVGYIPSELYHIWTSSTADKDRHFDYWFGMVSYLSLRFSECLNPVMYNLGSGKLRRETAEMLKRLRK